MRILFLLVMMAFSPLALGQRPAREQTHCDYLNGMLGSVDYDRDGVENCKDNCPGDANRDQKDADSDGIGDVCEWREQRRRKWEQSGRELRQQAREPVNLSKLIAISSDIVLGRLTYLWSDRLKGGEVLKVEVIRRFKDSTDPRYQRYERPMWVIVTDDGPLELIGELLLFLKNDKAREWRKPAVWPETLQPGVEPEGLKYFRYELSDMKNGVLGVSPKRLIEIERIIKSRNSTLRSNKRMQRTEPAGLSSTLAAALPLTAQAQTRTTRRAPARPAAKTAAEPTSQAAPPTATAAGINITAADMPLIIEGIGVPPEARTRLSGNAEERKDFASDIRRMLAAAEEAKAAGYLARPELKLQTELARAFVIAQAYFKQRQDAGVTNPEQVVTAAEIDALFNELATGPQFEAFLQDYSKNNELRSAPVSEETRQLLRERYGRVMVGMRKGILAALDRDRKTQLAVMLQQAKLLAGVYAQEMKARFQPTAREIDAYIAAHPEYDTNAERAKIEAILRRIRAGEDFARLADEFTEDPGGKGKGGDLGWFGRGRMVKPFEDAAFALRPGEISGVFETAFGLHIVKLDERRARSAGEEVRARHILIQYKSNARQPGFAMLPRDQAKAALEEEKRNQALDEAAVRRHIQVAEEFTIGTAPVK